MNSATVTRQVTELSPPLESRRGMRWEFIDGLRGLAACGVMLFHFHAHRLMDASWSIAPTWIPRLLQLGELGVAIFFVVSGFVLAHSLSGHTITPDFARSFVVRRALRLDPPYWLAIAVTVGTNWISKHMFGSDHGIDASVGQVVAHLFYLQEILGFEQLYPVFWTLCHEVQFYLLLLLLLAVSQWLRRSDTPRDPVALGIGMFGYIVAIGVTGILSATGAFQSRGWCLDTWYLFALGLLTHGVVTRALPWRWFVAIVLVIATWTIDAERVEWPQKIAGITTALILWLGASPGHVLDRLGKPPWRSLGQISYSLYLFHGLVGYRILSLADRYHGNAPTTAWLWLLLACGASIGSAMFVRRFVEQPALRWAERWKIPRPHTETMQQRVMQP